MRPFLIKEESKIQKDHHGVSLIAFLQYLILKGFSFFIHLLPEGFSIWIGRQFGRMAFHLDREHQQVALQNLRIAFGQEKSEREIYDIAKRTFQHLGMMAFEFFWIPRMDVGAF
jgi:lauroyl/myristoyl acyltransferase